MNRIQKCKVKHFIPQHNKLKITTKELFKDNIAPKVSQRNLKFNEKRNFGKDITNSIKNKNITVADRKTNYNMYIKKHSSATQVIQKNQKSKIIINDKKLRENKSGEYFTKKSEIYLDKEKNKSLIFRKENLNNNYDGSKLHNSISFGIDNILKPLKDKVVSNRIPSQKSNKYRNISNIRISMNKNDSKPNNDNDLM